MDSKEVRIRVAIDTVLGDMKGTIDKLDNGLKKGITKMDIGKGIGASLTKNIEKFRDEYANLSKLTEGNSIKFGDSKEAIQSGEKLVKLYKEIHSQTGRLQNLSGLDLKKIFPDAFDRRVSTLQSQMQSLQNIFLQINEKELKLKIADEELQTSRTQLKELSDSLVDTTAKQQAFNKAQAEAATAKLDLEEQEKSAKEAEQALDGAKQALEELRESFRQQINLNLGKIDTEIKDLEGNLEKLRKKKAELEASGDTKGAAAIGKQITSTESTIKTKTAERKKVSTAASKIQTADPKKLAELAIATTSDLTAQTAALKKAQQAYGDYTTAQKAADAASGQVALARKEHVAAMDREQDALEELQAAEKSNTNTIKQIENVTKKIEEQENAVTTLTTQIEGLKTKLSTKGAADLKELIPDFSEESLKTQEGVEGIIRKLQELDDQRAIELIAELQKIDANAEDVADSVEQMRQKIGQVDEGAKDIKRTGQEIENLKNQVLQFFSLTNTVQLFRRAVTKALNTVKELDKTMTEAAVVTDFSVGDMWEKLPEYSANAQKLGVSINSMYQATTLYYQQGLKTNEALQVGIETMKMAKIAGMDSTEATKAMTAALRGFNMELNELSATKVNDVYSQLAAVTAADTSQIATAMEKTASIAASANMEFETTAALLAQIIETTQEAPETAGTAMKTIIARFSEVKSLRNSGKTSGTDSEGEELDVNKIQTALRTVGISMEGFFNGTEGLDSVLLKLAEKWGTLDFETQRYIATMAAGSRQQSRFIAMMSDYSRTTELVDEAQNSAGASQKQFEKTQDSLAAKLQKLSNAWDQFLMGLSNNEIIKGAVDFLTFVIEGVNKLTDALSGGNGLIKSIISLVTVLGSLKLARRALTGVMGKGLAFAGSKMGISSIQKSGTDTGQQINPMPDSQTQGDQAGTNWAIGFLGAIVKKLDSGRHTVEQKASKLVDGEEGAIAGERFASVSEKTRARYEKRAARGLKSKYGGIGFARRGGNQEHVVQSRKGYLNEIANINKDLKDFDMEQVQQAFDETYQKTQDLGKAMDAANEKTLKMGGTLTNTSQQAKMLKNSTGGLTQAFQVAGTAAFGVGTALGVLSGLLDSLGFEEGAEACSILSAVFMGLGSVLTVIPGLIKTVESVAVSAGIAVQAAWWWLVIILGVLTAIIALIVVFIKGSQKMEKQLEEVNNQIDQMNAASEEAAEALEKITETREELAKMQDVFSGLVEGTTEWRKALVDSNAKVLELLDLYPQLAGYITTTEDGLMEISTAGWTEITKQQTQAVINTQAIAAGLSNKRAELEEISLDVQYKKGKINYEQYQIKKQNMGLQKETQANSFRTNAIASSEYLSNSEYAQNAAAALSLTQSSEEISQRIDELTKTIDTKDEGQLVKEYAQITGQQENDVKKKLENEEITAKDMATTIATQQVIDESVKTMEGVARSISRISDENTKKVVSRMLTEDGKKLKKSDIDFIKEQVGSTNAEAIGKYLQELGIQLDSDALAALEQNLINVSDAYATNLSQKLINLGFTQATQGGSEVVEFIEGTDYGTSQELVSKIGELSRESASTEEISQTILSMKELINNIDDEEARNSALQMLAESNWDSKESIIGAVDYIKTLEGADIEGLDELSKNIIQLSGAVSENTSAQLRDKGYRLSELIEMLKTGDLNEDNLTSDQKDLIKSTIGAKESDFVSTGSNSFQYRGDLYSKAVTLYADNVENQGQKYEEAEQNYNTALKYKDSEFEKKVQEINDFQWTEVQGLSDEEVIATYGTDDLETVKYGNWVAAGNTASKDSKEWKEAYAASLRSDHAIERQKTVAISAEQEQQQEEIIANLYKQIAKTLGEEVEENLTTEQMIAKINEWDEQWKDTDQYKNQLAQTRKDSAELVQTNLTKTTSEIGWEITGDKETQKDYNEARSKALEGRLLSTGGTVFVDQLNNEVQDALKGSGKEADEFADAINALASDMAVVSTKIKTFATNVTGLSENLNKDKRGSIEYGQALGTAKLNVASMFGIGLDELDAAGISDELYENLAAGDPNALAQMQQQIAGSLMVGTVPLFQALSNVTITPTMDQEAILALYEALGGTAEDFNKDMNGALAFIQSRLSVMGTQFAYQIDAAGNASAVTTQMDYSSIFDFYKPTNDTSESSKWENQYDEFYNDVVKINAELRKREKLELRYSRLLERNAATATKLSKVKYDQLAHLSSEREQRDALLNQRINQMFDIESEYSDLSKYAWYDDKLGVQIDWSKLEELDGSTDEELTARVDEYISKLEEQQGLIEQEQDSLDDIEDTVWEIYEQGKDEYFDLEDQIKEALVNSYQDEIDKLSEINETINETNSDLLDSMQEQIDEYRQTRDNQETEDEIADKQRKLAYLQMDTSGANAAEILSLQEEIDEAQEDYTDTLIDQKISDLQDQNDAAAEQRERQIEIAQAQLDHYVESGAIWDEVYSLMKTGLNPDTGLVTGSSLETLLKSDAGWEAMSKLGQMDWLNEINTNVASALSWLSGGAMQTLFGEGNSITFKDDDGNTVTGTVNKNGDVEVFDKNGNKLLYSGASFSMDAEGNVTSTENAKTAKSNWSKAHPENDGDSSSNWPSNLTKPSKLKDTISQGMSGAAVKSVQTALKELGYDIGSSGVDGSFGPATEKAVKAFQKDMGIEQDGRVGPNTRSKFKLKGFETGGLADFTGPAWLDGTKAKPEYILNAEQTKAFFALVDVLSNLQSGASKSSEKTGDNNYDIDINVESIGSDYDVEQIYEKIKNLIVRDARYRNNNVL